MAETIVERPVALRGSTEQHEADGTLPKRPVMRGRKIRTRLAGRYMILVVGAIVMIGPFLWMINASLKTDRDIQRIPPSILPNPATGTNYTRVVNAFPFWRFMGNSLVVSLLSTFLQLFLASTAAYCFARIEFKGRNLLFGLYLATMMIPLQVVIVPLFIEMRNLHLVNSYAGLLLPTIVSSFGTFLMRQAFMALPKDLDEAAHIDGAGHIRIFFKILLPLTAPSLATFSVFAFMSSWNAFLWPLVITRGSQEHMTLPVGLSLLQGRYQTSWNVLMAGSVLTIAPIVIFYVFTQRWVVRSVAFNASKG